MVEFGIHLAGPTAEAMGDRHEYLRELLRRGEGAFTSGWVSDHLMKDDAPMLEGWTAIAYLAAEFPAYAFGNLVLSQSYRNPALLAKMAATLDYLTGGRRLVLGLGAGWQGDEYRAYGYPFPTAATRVEQLREAIEIIRALWTQSPATVTGVHYAVTNAYCEPRPRTPIPILVGGRRPKLMRVAAEQADIWQWDGPIERYRPPYERLVQSCLDVGRDVSEVRLSVSGEAYFPVDRSAFPSRQLVQVTAEQDPEGVLAGEYDWVMGPTPEDAVRELRPLIDLGVDHVTVYFHDRRSLDLFAAEVIPAFA
jgi:alkanesulfonate monooxygenase SsuD/methylene tetrahydromethanopterin reductase-like flavin-dependent oxidoreductase (luciferase family)